MLATRTGAAVDSAPARATYLPARSICRSIPGFQTIDEYPVRSPLAVADFLAPIVRGRKFTEIGTRNGDVMGCLQHFARSVMAIELDKAYCRKLRERGFEVLCKPVEQATPSDLGDADVYFWWPMWSPTQNEAWLRLLISAHRRTGMKPAVAFVAHDTHWAPDMATLKRLAPYYHATNVTRIFFDEGDTPHTPTGRPGQWGVFHMARFELGPHVALPPRHADADALPPRLRTGLPAVKANWTDGFCAVTTPSDNIKEACESGEMGSLATGARFGIRTRQQCAEFCYARCRRCRYVSFSKEMGDCSWYNTCDMTQLKRTLGHGGAPLPFRTVRVTAADAPSAPDTKQRAARRPVGSRLKGHRGEVPRFHA